MNDTWIIKAFDALTVQQLHDVLRLRVDVFVVEQNCPYPEVDGLDPTALHLMLNAEDGELKAYARILPPGDDGLPHIGRIIVHPAYRGQGVAGQLMEQALEATQQHYGSRSSALAAQSHLERFYAQHGFERIGADYMLDGIPHVDMRRSEP